MKWIVVALLGWILAGKAFAEDRSAQLEASSGEWSKERVQAIFERAKIEMDVLRQLNDAPLELTQKELWWLWARGEQSIESRKIARRRGEEAEWLDIEKKGRRDPGYEARVFPVARDVLLSNPRLEEYLAQRLAHFKEVLLQVAADPKLGMTNREYPDVVTDFKTDLFFAEHLPTNMALRLIGPFLFSPYYPELNHGDYTEHSPAIWALSSLAGVAKKQLNEEIPKDIEGARNWWRANEHRFAIPPEPQPESKPVLPPAPAQTAPNVGTEGNVSGRSLSPKVFVWTGIGASVAALAILAILRGRRKS